MTSAPHITRYAAHLVVDEHQKTMEMCVVELTNGIVTSCSPLHVEEPFTEWLGGTITITTDTAGRKVALHNNKILK